MFRLIIGVFFGIILAIFISQNLIIVDFVFLVWTFTMSRALLFLIILILGIIIGSIFTAISYKHRNKKKIKNKEV